MKLLKRAHVALDRALLARAARIAGLRTFAAAAELALAEFVRRGRAKRILELRGTGAWEGDLGKMRGDRPTRRRR